MTNKKTVKERLAFKPQTLKGFRDFLPEEMKLRNYVLNIFKEVFESFGFEPLETPALEYASTLLDKYGEEADKLIYTFKDKGKRDVGLRYDLTVPVSRVLAQYNQQLGLPFKRYQIQPVWRAENPQAGRFREFIQCDIDTFGVKSVLADAEIVAATYEVLKKLGFNKFTIQINSRQTLFNLLKEINLKNPLEQLSVLRSLDKLEKQGREIVQQELKVKNLTDLQIKTLFSKIDQASPYQDLLEMFGYLEDFGVPDNSKGSGVGFKFVPSMVRGLDYYTGPIFETYLLNSNLGSLTGGGRYDNLIKLLGGPDLPGTGTTIGFDRLCEAVKSKNLMPSLNTGTKVLITIIPGYESRSVQLSQKLREQGIASELYLEEKPLDKQLKYANRKKIPYVAILGADEIKNNQLITKNMTTGLQQTLTVTELINKLK